MSDIHKDTMDKINRLSQICDEQRARAEKAEALLREQEEKNSELVVELGESKVEVETLKALVDCVQSCLSTRNPVMAENLIAEWKTQQGGE